MTPPNFCPNCGHDLRPARILGAVALAPVATAADPHPDAVSTAKVAPVPGAPRREEFASEDSWEEFLADSRAFHASARVEAATEAWRREKSETLIPTLNELLRWYEASAKVDGAANAKAIAEWREAQPCICIEHPPGQRLDVAGCARHDRATPTPTDKELVAWLRAKREGTAHWSAENKG